VTFSSQQGNFDALMYEEELREPAVELAAVPEGQERALASA
jgi:hypothetical protein